MASWWLYPRTRRPLSNTGGGGRTGRGHLSVWSHCWGSAQQHRGAAIGEIACGSRRRGRHELGPQGESTVNDPAEPFRHRASRVEVEVLPFLHPHDPAQHSQLAGSVGYFRRGSCATTVARTSTHWGTLLGFDCDGHLDPQGELP